LKNTEDWEPGERVQLLVYGPSKSGKTFGALTFPRPCVMDFDRGIATANNPDFIKLYGKRKVLYEQFYDTKRVKGGVVMNHNAFDDACRFFDEMMSDDKRDMFDTWVVDSGTTLSDAALNKAIVLLGSGTFKGISSKTHEEAKKHGLVVPKIQDYGSERSLVEQFVDMLLGADKHLVFICHEKVITNSDGVVTAVTPLLTGKGVEAVCLRFDEVYNLQVKGNAATRTRRLLTDSDGIRVAGSRYGIPSDIDWSWDSINAAFNKEK